jgi:hypothetical protein
MASGHREKHHAFPGKGKGASPIALVHGFSLRRLSGLGGVAVTAGSSRVIRARGAAEQQLCPTEFGHKLGDSGGEWRLRDARKYGKDEEN